MAHRTMSPTEGDYLDRVDCLIEVYREKIPGNGEDAFVYSANIQSALVGVFDGCGGAGAKRYPKLQDKTGAFTASRIAAGAVMEWFSDLSGELSDDSQNSVAAVIRHRMEDCHREVGEQSRLVSPLVRTFPTTAAFAICREVDGQDWADFFWAGDSRVYLLNEDGLAQLTTDDLSVQDAMENLYSDGVMTNLVSLSREFAIHHGRVILDKPGIVFAATDGCFGYVSSPMEFEGMLLSSLKNSHTFREWEEAMTDVIGSVAGDDYTLSGIVLGFGGFDKMRAGFAKRWHTLFREYLIDIGNLDREGKTILWERYRKNYSRFLRKPQE